MPEIKSIFWKSIFIGLLVFSLNGCQKADIVKMKPNILLILTDDQAYGDLSLTGNPISETPNLDLLAHQGVFFENFYVSPVCAPTRASLLTGRYHQRTGVSGVTRGRENMNLDEHTIADILKSHGYQTGIFGKWHNGAHYPYHPLGRGFDEFVGFTSGHWSSYFDTTIEKNGSPFLAKGYLPDVLTDEAISFIKRNSANKKPFFCYVPFQTPHTPLQVPDAYFDKYKKKGADDFNATIYGMVENIDDNVGRLLATLDEMQIREHTIIIYLSDNGPVNYRYNRGLKGKKGHLDEGGVRVPFILQWKDHVQQVESIQYPLAHIDLLPTLLDLLKIDHSFENPIDGMSFAPLLNNAYSLPKRDLYQEWGQNKRLLSDRLLMINDALYDLSEDPKQQNNIRNQNQVEYDSLRDKYETWFNKMPLEKELKKIPVGYLDFPTCVLPAHEANLFPAFEFRKDRRHTGIAYHSLYGWAHDWIDYWTKPSAYASWNIDLVASGTYDLEMSYALSPENKGTTLMIEIQGQKIVLDSIPIFEHSKLKSRDRIEREQEAPEIDWQILKLGSLDLNKGLEELKVSALRIPGTKSIELKGVTIKRIK